MGQWLLIIFWIDLTFYSTLVIFFLLLRLIYFSLFFSQAWNIDDKFKNSDSYKRVLERTFKLKITGQKQNRINENIACKKKYRSDILPLPLPFIFFVEKSSGRVTYGFNGEIYRSVRVLGGYFGHFIPKLFKGCQEK